MLFGCKLTQKSRITRQPDEEIKFSLEDWHEKNDEKLMKKEKNK